MVAAADAQSCFHCGGTNPSASPWRSPVDGAERVFCCAGCLGVAQTLHAAGLDGYYAQRAVPAGRPSATDIEWSGYDAVADSRGLARPTDRGRREASLLLEGLHCAACVWLIESYLGRQRGITEVRVNFASHRARVEWDPRQASLSDVLRCVAAIGYRAYPYDPARREALARREARALLTRTAIALLAMMQVMMFALPAYTTTDGIAPEQQALLGWASFALTLPVVVYCALPFFTGAWRNLRCGRLGMDVPVALGVGGAFAASVWSTFAGSGITYYDSVTMFVALLLVARYVELEVRRKAGDAIESIARDLPDTAERMPGYPVSTAVETVAAASLEAGDIVRVASGVPLPADGTVVEGRSSVEEAVLTGESRPRAKAPGDPVLAGSINSASPLLVRVTAAGAATQLASVMRLLERAAAARPRVARVADRFAAWFVTGLLGIAAATALYWWQADAARVLAVTFAVLAVSCPCALSLATPAALAAAAGNLGKRRILITRADALESLARVTHVVLDKTGTLTEGQLKLSRILPFGTFATDHCLKLACALEQGFDHPIGRALSAVPRGMPAARDIVAVQGHGVEGEIDGVRYRLGRPDWAGAWHGLALPADALDASVDATSIALADAQGWLAVLEFADVLKSGAPAMVAALKGAGLHVSLLSGDRDECARHIAQLAGIADVRGGALPADKCAHIAALQRRGAVVAMVGDGINDAPSLAQADVSLTFGSATPMTQWTADIVIVGAGIERIAEALREARRTFRVIHQNLVWAVGYNAIAIPLAATGYVTPLVAALGMSVSSVLVVANSVRLSRPARPAPERARACAAAATQAG